MKRKIYIAHKGGGGPVNVVLAPSLEMANTFWSGLGIHASEVEEIDPEDDSSFAVIALIGIRNQRIGDLRDRRPGDWREHLHLIVRGRGEEPR